MGSIFKRCIAICWCNSRITDVVTGVSVHSKGNGAINDPPVTLQAGKLQHHKPDKWGRLKDMQVSVFHFSPTNVFSSRGFHN